MSASAPPSSALRRQRALTALGAMISVAALAAIVLWAADQEPPALPTSRGGLAEFGAAIAFYLAGCAVRAERWY